MYYVHFLFLSHKSLMKGRLKFLSNKKNLKDVLPCFFFFFAPKIKKNIFGVKNNDKWAHEFDLMLQALWMKFFTALQSLKQNLKKNIDFGVSKMFWGKKLKFRYYRFSKILVLSVLAKFEVDISKTAGGDSFPVNLYFLTKTQNTANWQKCKFSKYP